MRICGNCGAPLEPDAQFCTECGTKVEIQEGRRCPSCGAPLDDDSLFCSECGCKVDERQSSPQIEEPLIAQSDESHAMEENVATRSSTDDILPAPKNNNHNQWLYPVGAIVAVILLALGGKLL